MQSSIKRAIITGGTGVLGTALIDCLSSKGIETFVLCNPSSQRKANIPNKDNVHIIECDISEISSAKKQIGNNCDVFFGLAWSGSFGAERLDIDKQMFNVTCYINSVKFANDCGCSVFIGAGSQSEFGNTSKIMNSDLSCKPNNYYGATKMMAGHITRIMCNQMKMKHIWFRILSLYGPYDNDRSLIMGSLKKMIVNEDIKLTNCDQMWDYLYSKDAAIAMILAAEKGVDNSIYCLGSGKVAPLKDYLTTMKRITNSKSNLVFGAIDYYPNQVMHMQADIGALSKDTGFCPKYSFEEGILETVEWLKKKG